jgi:hypothetical protein
LLYQQTELVFLNSSAQIAIVGWVNYQNEESYSAKLFLVAKSNEGKNNFDVEYLKTLNN